MASRSSRSRRGAHRLSCLAALLALWPAHARAATAPRPEQGPIGGLLPARAQFHDAYIDHPVVAEVQAAGYLTIVSRERALARQTPADRALAIVDAVGAEGATRNAVDRFLTQAIQARLVIGPSGALQKQDVTVAQLDARQALLLGWIRALSAGADRAVLTRRDNRLEGAGAIQLLERAAAAAPELQAVQVALALAQAGAETQPRKLCIRALALRQALRTPGAASIRLGAAEHLDALAEPLSRSCKPSEVEPFARPIQLPPPLAEASAAPLVIGERPTRPLAPSSGPQSFGIAFVVTAPVFTAYLSDPLIARLAARTRLDELMLEDALGRDATGDLAIAALNASLLMQRIGHDDNAEVAWLAVLRRHGLIDAAPDKQNALKVEQLSGGEAMALGYALALAGKGLKPAGVDGSAWTATPLTLFARGKRMVPGNAALGPAMVVAHTIDLERQTDLCRPARRVEALRFAVGRGTLPEAARPPLLQALATVDAQCQAASHGKDPDGGDGPADRKENPR